MHHIKNCTKNMPVQLNNQQIILLHTKLAFERHLTAKRLLKWLRSILFSTWAGQHTVYRITSTLWQPFVCVQTTPCYIHCAPTNDTYCNKCLLFYNKTQQILSLSAHILSSKTANPIKFMWDDDSKPIQKFYITGVPHIMWNTLWTAHTHQHSTY